MCLPGTQDSEQQNLLRIRFMSRRRRLAIVVAACLVWLSIAPQGPAFETPRPETIAVLVDQLSATELQSRVDAERQLRELGINVLTTLPDPRTLASPAADAVKRIRSHLERQQAQTALLATRVSLSGRMPLQDAIAAIAEQTGNRLDASALPTSVRDRTLSVDFVDVPFWEAVAVIEQQASAVAEPTDARNELVFRIRDDTETPPVAVVGPFRVTLVDAKLRRDFIQPNRRLGRFTFNISAEPRLRPLFLSVADADLAVTVKTASNGDDSPRPLMPLSPTAQREIPIDRPGPIQLTHDVILPERFDTVPISVSIRGSLDVEVAAGRERFDFRHLDETGPVTRRHGGVSVTLEDVQHSDEDFRASLRILYDADGPRFESHRSWVFHNDVSLTTSNDRVLLPAEYETLDEGDGGVQLRYRFAGVPAITDDTQLSYTAPTLITCVPVKFAFDSVTVESNTTAE